MSIHSPVAVADGGDRSIAVLGAGSWGTALAMQLVRGGTRTVLWGRTPGHLAAMKVAGCNQRYLPDMRFPEGLELEPLLETAVRSTDGVLIAVPSHAFVEVVSQIEPWLRPGQGITWACKGLEPGTGHFLHQAARQLIGTDRPLAVITGPTFAIEVAANLPTAVTVAGTDKQYCAGVAQALHSGNFRAYTSDDIVGAELGGAVKNVLAIATGISDGMGYGHNARVALITRGLAEMMRLGQILGAREQTLTGLAGMGDLVLTSTGDLSRNRRLGLALGAGKSAEETIEEIGQVVEGVSTSEEVWRLARRHSVEMPITEQINGIIHKGWDPSRSVRELLAREQKPEVI